MISQFCDWLASTSISQWFQDAAWFVPTVQTIHILSISVLMISNSVLALKLLGLRAGRQPLSVAAAYFLPWMWCALAVLLCTGILLTITEPARELMNNAFRAKMLMVLVLVGITLIVRAGLQRDPRYWASSAPRLLAGRSIASISLVLSVCIVVAGRWIAYT